MALIKKYPKGSNISILNVTYQGQEKNPITGKYDDDYVVLIYKDNNTGVKHHEIIKKPEYEFYIANDDVQIDHHLDFIDEALVHPVTCRASEIEKTLAQMTNGLDVFYDNIRSGNRKANRQFHFNNYVFGSDINIEDYYLSRFDMDYTNTPMSVNKAYFDIEVDTIDMAGDFPQPGECPINAVSYIDDKTKTINAFLLRNPNNPQIEEFENVLKNPSTRIELFKELQQFIIDNCGGPDKYKKFGLEGFRFNFQIYDEEIRLIQDLFLLINRNQPDFLLAWNMAFDIPYIVARISALGYSPIDIMCDQSFEEKYVKCYVDTFHKNEYELRGDFYKIASNTVYLDQLIQFASRRKGQSAFPDYKLDTVADIVTKGAVRKLDYSHITTNIAKLPYLSYKTFVFYNIMDTLAQKCIESSNNDIDFVYTTSISNNTRYAKCHRQTVYLIGGARKFFREKGYIMGNNVNTGNGPKFAGALVGDPLHNSDYGKMKIIGLPVDLFDNLDDFDFKSLYPSIARQHNMAGNTQIGKILIEGPVHKYENPYDYEYYDRGGQFAEDLSSGNVLEFSRRWMGLASIREMIEDMGEYLSMNIYSQQFIGNNIKPFSVLPEKAIIHPFSLLNENEKIHPFILQPDKTVVNEALDIFNTNRGI